MFNGSFKRAKGVRMGGSSSLRKIETKEELLARNKSQREKRDAERKANSAQELISRAWKRHKQLCSDRILLSRLAKSNLMASMASSDPEALVKGCTAILLNSGTSADLIQLLCSALSSGRGASMQTMTSSSARLLVQTCSVIAHHESRVSTSLNRELFALADCLSLLAPQNSAITAALCSLLLHGTIKKIGQMIVFAESKMQVKSLGCDKPSVNEQQAAFVRSLAFDVYGWCRAVGQGEARAVATGQQTEQEGSACAAQYMTHIFSRCKEGFYAQLADEGKWLIASFTKPATPQFLRNELLGFSIQQRSLIAGKLFKALSAPLIKFLKLPSNSSGAKLAAVQSLCQICDSASADLPRSTFAYNVEDDPGIVMPSNAVSDDDDSEDDIAQENAGGYQTALQQDAQVDQSAQLQQALAAEPALIRSVASLLFDTMESRNFSAQEGSLQDTGRSIVQLFQFLALMSRVDPKCENKIMLTMLSKKRKLWKLLMVWLERLLPMKHWHKCASMSAPDIAIIWFFCGCLAMFSNTLFEEDIVGQGAVIGSLELQNIVRSLVDMLLQLLWKESAFSKLKSSKPVNLVNQEHGLAQQPFNHLSNTSVFPWVRQAASVISIVPSLECSQGSVLTSHSMRLHMLSSLRKNACDGLQRLRHRMIVGKLWERLPLTVEDFELGYRSGDIVKRALDSVNAWQPRDLTFEEDAEKVWDEDGRMPPVSRAADALIHNLSLASAKSGHVSQFPVATAGTPPAERSWILLRYAPFLVPFQYRLEIFKKLANKDQRFSDHVAHQSIIEVRRSHLFEDGIMRLGALGAQLRRNVRVSFTDEFGMAEAGIDGGGLFKELLTQVLKEAFDPRRGLFAENSSRELYPSPASMSAVENAQMLYLYLGRIVGKAMYGGILAEIRYAPFFLSKFLRLSCPMQDLSSLDPELSSNLRKLLDYDNETLEGTSLDFTIDVQRMGETTTYDLLGNGQGQQVTVKLDNVIDYVLLVSDYFLNKQLRIQAVAFVKGFYDVMCPDWVKLFDVNEIQMLISGNTEDIDIEDWRQHTVYNGYEQDSPEIQTFWKAVESFTAKERSKLLLFCTSCSRPPLLGFRELNPKFAIHKIALDGGEQPIPTASTCMNLLNLPAYTDVSLLANKLRIAIENSTGFYLA